MLVKRKFRTSVCKRHDDEMVVQNGLSLTPSQMMDLTKQGFSISSQNLRYLDAIDPADHDFYIPLQYRRGVDMADLSVASQEMKSKLRKAIDKYDKGEIQDVSRKE